MAWDTVGNAGTNPTSNFLGTTDSEPLVIRTNGTERVRVGPLGNVSIGTLEADHRLTIAADFDGDGLLLIGSDSPKDVGISFGDNQGRRGVLGFVSAPNAFMNDTGHGDLVLRSGTGRVVAGVGDGTAGPMLMVSNDAVTIVGRLRFGEDSSGETISSQRGAGANQWGIDFFTNRLPTPRMSITNAGNVGIGTQTPGQMLTVAGMIESLGGFKYPDGSIQTTATLIGLPGVPGANGEDGAQGPQGPPGPAVHTSAACGPTPCGFACGTVVAQHSGPCYVTSDTGSCKIDLQAQYCCVCRP